MIGDDEYFLQGEFSNSSPQDAVFHVIPVPFEATVSYGGGTAAGPAAIIHASRQLEAFDGTDRPGDRGIHTRPSIECDAAPEKVLSGVYDAVTAVLETATVGAVPPVPVTLGGEHSITAPAVQALRDHYTSRGKSVGVIQIDAHADLRRTYEGTPLSHACVMRRTHEAMQLPLVQLGVRALCEEEVRYRRDAVQRHEEDSSTPSLTWYDAAHLVPTGRRRFEIPGSFPDLVYITLDVDGLDPSLCPATGTPVPGGIGWYQVLDLIAWITAERRVVGFDMVELAPIPGMHAPDYTVAELTYRIMGMIGRKHAGAEYRCSQSDGGAKPAETPSL